MGQGTANLITSTRNNRIKEIRQLQAQAKARREENAFVVEGVRLCEEAVAAGWKTRLCLYSPDLNERGQALVQELIEQGVPAEAAAEHVIKAASDTQSPQGIILVLSMDPLPMPENPDFILILDHVQDPGNQGTLLRTAAAAGADAVLISEGSADVFAPKVIRAGMGAHFRLPMATWTSDEIISFCRRQRLEMWAAVLNEGTAYTQARLDEPSALIIGSEAHGVGVALSKAARPLHIPMPGGGESLNAAAAGAILLYEAVRQRSG